MGILISGATDFVYKIGDWDENNAPCREFARCAAGMDSVSYCRQYDTSASMPNACATSADSNGDNWQECASACRDNDGTELHECTGENIASVAAIIAYLEANIPASRSCTYNVASTNEEGSSGLADGCSPAGSSPPPSPTNGDDNDGMQTKEIALIALVAVVVVVAVVLVVCAIAIGVCCRKQAPEQAVERQAAVGTESSPSPPTEAAATP